MIISRTPYRMSFVGGGSDLPVFYENNIGMVLSATIKKYMYITVHPSFDPGETRIILYNKTEIVQDASDITHPLVKAILKKLDIQHGLEITSVGDIPAQTGLGSSSSFTVGLLMALYCYQNITKTREEIAREACEIEMDILNEPIGKQDQYSVTYGGLNQFVFNKDGAVGTFPLTITVKSKKLLEKSLLLFFTGTTRKSSDILLEQQKNIAHNKQKNSTLQKMVDLVLPLRYELEKGNIDSLGDYLHQNWILKRQLSSQISSPDIDLVYEKARKLGAIGGKILGAGGGGFFLFYCPVEKQTDLVNNLGLKSMNVELDNKGSEVIKY